MDQLVDDEVTLSQLYALWNSMLHWESKLKDVSKPYRKGILQCRLQREIQVMNLLHKMHKNMELRSLALRIRESNCQEYVGKLFFRGLDITTRTLSLIKMVDTIQQHLQFRLNNADPETTTTGDNNRDQ